MHLKHLGTNTLLAIALTALVAMAIAASSSATRDSTCSLKGNRALQFVLRKKIAPISPKVPFTVYGGLKNNMTCRVSGMFVTAWPVGTVRPRTKVLLVPTPKAKGKGTGYVASRLQGANYLKYVWHTSIAAGKVWPFKMQMKYSGASNSPQETLFLDAVGTGGVSTELFVRIKYATTR